MELIETVRRLFHGKRYEQLSQEETEALVDALCYAVAADGKIAEVEREQLSDVLEDVAWSGDVSLSAYIDESFDRAGERIERGEDPELYARSIRDRLQNQDAREDVYMFAAKIAAADQDLTKNEQELLSELVEEFDISDETLDDVTHWIINQSDLKGGESIPADAEPRDEELREEEKADKTPGGDQEDAGAEW